MRTNHQLLLHQLRPFLLIVLLLFISATAFSQVSELQVSVTWPNWSSDNKVEVFDPSGNLIISICDPVNCENTTTNSAYNATFDLGCYLDQNNYFIIATDAFGDAWNGTSNVTVNSGGSGVLVYDLTDCCTSGQVFFNVSGGGSCQANDASIPAVNAPLTGCGLSASEPVNITIRNHGSSTITTCPIVYSLNGGPSTSAGSYSGSIPSGGVDTYTFNVDVSAANNYTLDITAQLTGDANAANDAFNDYTFTNSAPHDFTSGDFTMGFEASENIGGWEILDDNADAITWDLENTTNPNTGARAARYVFTAANAADDYFFTPCLTLEAGATYNLDYFYRVQSATFPEDLEILITSAPNSASVVSTIETLNNLINTTYAQSSNTFTVPATGTYYLAWHAISPADQWQLFIDDIAISKIVALDASIQSIDGPADNCNLSSTETVTVTIENIGTTSLTNIPIEYQIDGGGYQSGGSYTGPAIITGATASYNFTADLSGAGTHTIDVRTQLVGDENASNDEVAGYTVTNQSYDLYNGPLMMGFEPADDFGGWLILNNNGDNREWDPDITNTPNTGVECARLRRSNGSAQDDYLFTECLNFRAGVTYQVSYFYRCSSASFAETIELVLATDQSVGGVTSVLQTQSGFTNTAYQQATQTFTVPSTGTYYLAWHATSPSNRRNIHLDDIDIRTDSDIWIGNTTDWSTPGNWTNGEPVTGTKTIIPTSPDGGNFPNITASEAAGEVNIEAGATINFTGSGQLAVSGDWNNLGTFDPSAGTVLFDGSISQGITGISTFYNLTVNNPTDVTTTGQQQLRGALSLVAGTFDVIDQGFLLISDASETARVTEITGGSISGEMTVQRYIAQGATNWRFLSSPVSGINFEEWDDDFITSGFTGSDFPNFSFVSIYKYDETQLGFGPNGWEALATSAETINAGEGYWVWCGDSAGGTSAFIIDVTGSVNTGNVNLPVTFTASAGASEDGWEMVGNPYPCPIDWQDAGWTKTNMNDATYIWDPQNGQYATFVGGVGANGGERNIASGQAFWVQANGASPVLQATEAVKVDLNQPFFQTTAPGYSHLELRMEGVSSYYDETIIKVSPDATISFDGQLDAYKRFSDNPSVPHLSSIQSGSYLAVNSLPELTQTTTIPLFTAVGISGTYTFRFDGLESFDQSTCLVLEDLETGIITNMLTDTVYDFYMADTSFYTRFLVHMTPPVKTTTTDASCFENEDGKVVAFANGTSPWIYEWQDAQGTVLRTSGPIYTSDTLENIGRGSYTVKISQGGFCPEVSKVAGIISPDAIVASFQPSRDRLFLSEGATVELENFTVGANDYSWEFGDGAISSDMNPSHTYTSGGTFDLRLTASQDGNCASTFDTRIQVTDDLPTGIQENSLSELINVYQAGEHYFVSFTLDQTTEATIQLFSTMGQPLHVQTTQVMNGSRVQLDLSDVASGVYLVDIQMNDAEIVKKIVVQ